MPQRRKKGRPYRFLCVCVGLCVFWGRDLDFGTNSRNMLDWEALGRISKF